jgi:recombination protein RecT
MSAKDLKAAATGQPSTAVTTNSPSGFAKFLEAYKPQLQAVLPKHITPDRMARLALTAFSQSEKLQKSDPMTIIASMMTASQMGLEIGVNGQGYLIPYKNTRANKFVCQFVPGWKGLVDLVNRSGRATVWTGAVFKGDEFDFGLGDRPFISHKPGDEDDPKQLAYVYAVGRVNGSEWPVLEVWRMGKIWKHRDKINKVGTDHYSYRDPEMYARKVPLLQVLKYLPQSIDVANAVALSDAQERGSMADIIDGMVKITDVDEDDTPPAGAAATNSGGPKGDSGGPSSNYEEVRKMIDGAKNRDDAAAAFDLARGLPDSERNALDLAFQARWPA